MTKTTHEKKASKSISPPKSSQENKNKSSFRNADVFGFFCCQDDIDLTIFSNLNMGIFGPLPSDENTIENIKTDNSSSTPKENYVIYDFQI